ncbi:hypothetical protein EHW66_20740 [Erwinia psidii]|uniref:hypothetical protein n=1 Tax=Erwinia psidii TaxID=69224 RepID=UPI00226B696A|nr:hypothetical protein [Erwinia psidii]MCX8967310.1 hypothetical protein [Erwinia psidii]
MANAATCLVLVPTGNQTAPFVRKRHVVDPYPRKRIGMVCLDHIRGIILFAVLLFSHSGLFLPALFTGAFLCYNAPPVPFIK